MRLSEIEKIKLRANALVSMAPVCGIAAITVLLGGVNESFTIAVFGGMCFFGQGRYFLRKAEKELEKLDNTGRNAERTS